MNLTHQPAPIRATSPTVRAIFEFIDSHGFLDQKVATATGISRTAIGYWRAGYREPNIVNIERLCKAVGLVVEIRPPTTEEVKDGGTV